MQRVEFIQGLAFAICENAIRVELFTELLWCGDWQAAVGGITESGEKIVGSRYERYVVKLLEGGFDGFALVGVYH